MASRRALRLDGAAWQRFVWTVPLGNADATYDVPDDGRSSCSPKADDPCGGPVLFPASDPDATPTYEDDGEAEGRARNLCSSAARGAQDGDNGYDYVCGGNGTGSCATLRYNALLFFFLADLGVASAPKNHTEGSSDWMADVAACHPTTSTGGYSRAQHWPCPAGDDDREGNSHAYHPGADWPRYVYAGRDNHGGSADCDADAAFEQLCHATRRLDIYYGTARVPPEGRTFRVFDLEGSTAPYHCHSEQAACSLSAL